MHLCYTLSLLLVTYNLVQPATWTGGSYLKADFFFYKMQNKTCQKMDKLLKRANGQHMYTYMHTLAHTHI